jgi:tetratricopeptide (TPR) repeat protein
MEESDHIRAQRLSRISFRLGVVSVFLLALVFPLGRFFVFTVAGFISLFFGFWFHYRRLSRDPEENRLYDELKNIPNVRPSGPGMNPKFKTAFLAVLFIIFSFTLVLVAIVWGNNSRVTPAEEWLGTGSWHLNNSAYDSAIFYFDKALEVEPQNTLALYNKGLSLYNLGRYQEATVPLEMATEFEPGYSEAMLLLGDCHYNAVNYPPALEWYTKAYELGERSANLSHLLAFLHDNKGESDPAIAFYKETLSMDSSRVDIYERLAVLEPVNANEYNRLAGRWKSQ